MNFIKVFLVILFFVIFSDLSKSASEILYAPFDSSKVQSIHPQIALPNQEGGYLILGNVVPKQSAQFEDNPEGIFLLNLVPDNVFVLKQTFFSEFFLPRPITVGKHFTNVYYNDKNNIVIVTSWNKYYTSGGYGSSGCPIPYVIEFDQQGKLISAFVDSLSDIRNNSLFAPFTPSLINEDKSFTLFNNAAPDSIKYLFASKYDKYGVLVERMPIISMRKDGKDSLDKEENRGGGWYEPISVINDQSGNIYLNTDRIRTFSGSSIKKTSSYIFKLDKNMRIVKQMDLSFFDLDAQKHKVRTSIDEMFVNRNDDLVIFGKHGLINGEVKSGYNNKFVYILSKDDFSIKTKKEWKDTLYNYYQIIEKSAGGYLIAGAETNHYSSEYYSTDNQTNYVVLNMDKEFNIEGKYANKEKKYYNDYLTIASELKSGEYDIFGNLNRRALYLRLHNSDFITDVDDIDLKEDFSIFPNPAEDFITINLSGINPTTSQKDPTLKRGVDELNIYNTLGEKVMAVERTPSSVQQINISTLPRGIYFVKVGDETAKFVKM